MCFIKKMLTLNRKVILIEFRISIIINLTNLIHKMFNSNQPKSYEETR